MNDVSPQDKSCSLAQDEFAAVIAIGGSWGAINSLDRFFGAMPAKTGFCFIVHVPATAHQSNALLEVLSQAAGPPVEYIEEGTELVGDRIYLCPAFCDVVYSDGRLQIIERRVEGKEPKPFDNLLNSLAVFGEKCAAVLLSSGGADGIKGCRDLRERGGVALVESAGADTLSGETSATREHGYVDWTLQPEDMPQLLIDQHQVDRDGEEHFLDSGDEKEDALMQKLLSLVENVTHVNFKQYKIATLKRRIAHQMRRRGLASLEFYVEYAEQHPDELQELYRSFMIGVTSFFRDEGAFQRLAETVLPEIYRNRDPSEEIRIWVSGCATGEEAYSIAMLLDEYARSQRLESIPCKIFATDAHPPSIYSAVQGYFSAEAVEMVSEDRLKRYFTQSHNHFQINPDIRKRVVFAEHNILRDPPFTKVDLVVCRNLLIYFNSAAQKKALCMMLFALRSQGFMFLGKSESPSEFLDQFQTVDGKWRIFRKDGKETISPKAHFFKKGDRLPKRIGETKPHAATAFSHLPSLMQSVMEQRMPASLIVSSRGEIAHTFGDCYPYLQPIRGKASLMIEDRAHPTLRLAISACMQRALSEKKEVECCGLNLGADGKEIVFDMTIDYIGGSRMHDEHLFVSFKESETSESREVDNSNVIKIETSLPSSSDAERNANEALLKRELQQARAQLEESVGQLEISNQELQMANEELLTSNEELQSTNEELHSVNEELFSVNSEYELKNRELIDLNEDVNNLLRSTEIGTVFIDPNLRIRKFTPAAAGTLNLLEQDIGRPIEHVSHKFLNYEHLVGDIQRVIETAAHFEREAKNTAKQWLLVRILPFRTDEGKPNGAVLTLVDITALKQAEFDVLENQRKLQLALEAADFGVWSWDVVENKIDFDDRLARILELDRSNDAQQASFLDTMNMSPEFSQKYDFNEVDGGQGFIHHSWSMTMKSGELRYLSGRGIVYRDSDGNVERLSGVIWDETDIKSQEQQVLQKKNDLETLLYVISHDLREPLRAIQSFSQLLVARHSEQLEEKARDFVHRIDAGAKRMSVLLEDVLNLSRINRMDTPKERVAGRQIIDVAMRSLDTKAQETNAEILIANDLPEMRVNFTYAKQALYNLIGNALKFTREGEPPSIEIGPYEDGAGRYAGFVVRDRGPGIPKDCEERVFKLFQRAVGRDIEGTGAGLAIVKQIALKHGGDVWYEPRPGGGSKFTISFLAK